MLDLTKYKKEDCRSKLWLDHYINSQSRNDNGRELRSEVSDVKDTLYDRYKEYDSIILNREKVPVKSVFFDSKKISNALQRMYTNPVESYKREIIDKRKEHNLKQCPFCGKPCDPSILDHFMPKSIWPEFSLYENNLIPQCEKCSSKKHTKYYCHENNTVKFIHPYYFDVLSKTYFDISISYNDHNIKLSEIVIRLAFDENLSEDDRRNIRVHVSSLDLSDNIYRYCNKELLSIFSQYEKGVDVIEKIKIHCSSFFIEKGKALAAVSECTTCP